MCGKAESFGRQEISSKSDLSVQRVLRGMSEWALTGVWVCLIVCVCVSVVCDCVCVCARARREGQFQKSPYGQAHSLMWVVSNAQTDVTKSPTVLRNESSKPPPECREARGPKLHKAVRPQKIISPLSGRAKQGDSYLRGKNPARSSNSEGVGKPFLMKKGWKQKHKSANIENSVKWLILYLN